MLSADAVDPPARRSACASRSNHIDLLLLDAEYRQTLASMRAYARSGLGVGAVACQSRASWAPSFRSRWCSRRAVVPDFSCDAHAYVDGILKLIEQWSPSMVLPAHDGSIEALRARRAEIERQTALPLASEHALDIAVSKARTLALGAELGIAVPCSVPVRDPSDVPAALRDVGLPAVVKPVRSWLEQSGRGTRVSSQVAENVEQAQRSLEGILAAGGGALIQRWLPGRREAVSLFYSGERFWARFAQVSHREWPVLGGVSVLCESIPLLPDITEAAERLVRAMDLEGCSMVEFRRDREGRPVLMEVNPRMGASVGLAIDAGVNFPELLRAWKLGGRLAEVTTYQVGRRLRWLPGDIWHLKCAFDSQGHPDVPPRSRAAMRFLMDFASRANRLDVVEAGDMGPFWVEMDRIVLHHARNRLRRYIPTSRLAMAGRVR